MVVVGAISGIAAAPDWMIAGCRVVVVSRDAARPSAASAASAVAVATRRRWAVAVMSCVLPMAMRRSAARRLVPVLEWSRWPTSATSSTSSPTAAGRSRYPEVEVAPGMVVEDRSSGFCGDVVTWTIEAVTLRDRQQHQRHFAWKPGGFLLEGRPVTLRRPAVAPRRRRPTVTASGSVAGPAAPAKVAAASRIWVEGRHDAELVEHVWGDDLREIGSSSSRCTASTTCRRRSPAFRPGAAAPPRHPRRPPRRRVQGVPADVPRSATPTC